MIGAVIPTIPGREYLLVQASRSLPDTVRILHIPNSKSWGWGCNEGAKHFLSVPEVDAILFFADDMEIITGLEYAHTWIRQGRIPSPVILNEDDSFQQWGGWFVREEIITQDGEMKIDEANYTICPFLPKNLVEQILPFPDLHHFADIWVSECLKRFRVPHLLMSEYVVKHKIITQTRNDEGAAYGRWRTLEYQKRGWGL